MLTNRIPLLCMVSSMTSFVEKVRFKFVLVYNAKRYQSGNFVALRGPFYGHESGPYCVRTRRILRITRISHNIVAYRNTSFVTRLYMFFVTVF